METEIPAKETAPKNETQEYRRFKDEFATIIADVAVAFRTLVERGDQKAVATLTFLLLTMGQAALDELEKQWPSNLIPGGLGDKQH